jgi:hypothetical protein
VVTSSSKSTYGGEPDRLHASRPQTVTVPAARPDLTPQFTEPDLGSLGAPEELDVDPFTGALT